MAESPNPVALTPPPVARMPDADADWSGRTLGEFQILRKIGRGGMGQVFLAEQKSLKRKVALKILRPELAANPTALIRFHTEAEAVAKLTHANIVQVHAIGEQDGIHYMALEYVEGRNLRDFLNRKGPPDLQVSISIMRQVAAALQRAGEQGFVHRDVKPENILVTRKGEVKVADFGLTRCLSDNNQPLNLTQSGVAMGTPLYMSPEQVQGQPVDHRSDIYSFGVTCFHLLAGQPPFRGASAFDVALQHVQTEPPHLAAIRPDLPLDLCDVVSRMMAKNPNERYQTCKDVIRDLNKVREGLSGGLTVPQVLPLGSGIGPSGSSGTLTAPLPSAFDGLPSATFTGGPPSRRWVPKLIVGVILVVMIAGGLTVRALKERLSAKEPAKPAANTATETQPVISSDEKFLLDAANLFANPNEKSVQDLKRGLSVQVDLAVYYFKKNRLDDAEKFFQSLNDSHAKRLPDGGEHPYHFLARLGHGLVLAFHDKPDESFKELAALIPTKPLLNPNPTVGAIRENFDFSKILADGLNRNLKNLKLEWMPEKYAHLEPLRRPPEARPFSRPFGDKAKKN